MPQEFHAASDLSKLGGPSPFPYLPFSEIGIATLLHYFWFNFALLASFSLLILGGDYNFWLSGASPCSKNLGVEFKQPLWILSFKLVSWHFRVVQFLKQVVNQIKTKQNPLTFVKAAPVHIRSPVCGDRLYSALHLVRTVDWPFNLAYGEGGIRVSILSVALSLTHPFIHSFSKYLLRTSYLPDNRNPEESRTKSTPSWSLCSRAVYFEAE